MPGSCSFAENAGLSLRGRVFHHLPPLLLLDLMNILIAEDSKYQNRVLQAMLESWGHTVLSTTSGTAALDILTGKLPPQLAILDWEMPGKTGLEVCAELRARSNSYIYVILLTAKDRPTDLVEGLTGGADDFMRKPANPMELWARICVGERMLAIQRQLIEARDRLRFEATHDALTGVWNRRAILEFLDHEIARSFRHSTALSALLIDVDHFKSINDTYGHSTGDRVLLEIARTMNELMRSYDFLGRFGGEEFLAILPTADETGAAEVGERLRDHVRRIKLADEPQINISISIGACTHNGNESAGEMLEMVDSALYRAKAAGRNRVEVVKRI